MGYVTERTASIVYNTAIAAALPPAIAYFFHFLKWKIKIMQFTFNLII